MTVSRSDGEAVFADLAGPDDMDDILRINRAQYGPRDILSTAEGFAWRRDANPAGQAVIPVVRDGRGRVVGFYWFVPMRVRVRGEDRDLAMGSDLLIHPRYRDGLAYAKLMRRSERAYADAGVPLHFGFSTVRRGAGWTVPRLVRPLLPWSRGRSDRLPPGIRTETLNSFGPEFDDLWLRVRDKYAVMLVRDCRFLSWRFADASGRRHVVVAARSSRGLEAYAVVRIAPIRRVRVGLIMDFIVAADADESFGNHVVAAALAYMRRRRVLVSMAMVSPRGDEHLALRRAGYVDVPDTILGKRLRFAYYETRHVTSIAPFQKSEWFLTFADYEGY